MSVHRCKVAPLATRRFDAGLAVTIVSVYGYRASCSCEWRGPVRSSFGAARADLAAHTRPPAALPA